MKLSIIIPVHNEAVFIQETIERVFTASIPFDLEVVVVDDGSTDSTGMILSCLQRTYALIVKTHTTNEGKGAALKTGFRTATGDFVLIQDADLEYHPNDISKLLEQMKTDEMVAVYGNRGTSAWPPFRYHYMLGAKLLTILFNILYKQKVHDLYTGYKVFRRTDILSMDLQSTGFEFEAEVSCLFIKKGGKIVETPINYSPRRKDEGKHIGYRDALEGISTIIKNLHA